MALSTNIHPISTHRVRPRAGLVIDRIWMRRKARGRTAYRSTSLARLLLQLVRLPRRANLREIDHGTGDRSADHFNSLQVASSDSDVFGQFQGAIGVLERRGATVSHGIEVHHRQRDGVGADWVHASDDHARAARGGSRDPRPFAGRHGFDAFDDGQMDGPGGYQVNHNTRHAISFQPGRTRVLLLERALGRLPPAVVEAVAPAAMRGGGGLIDAGAVAIDGDGRVSKAVLHGAGIAGRRVFLHLGDADKDIAIRKGVVQIEARVDVSARGHHQARVFLALAEIVGVFELDVRSGIQNIERLQIRLEEEFLYRIRGGPDALEDADARGSGPGNQVHGGADHGRIREMRLAQWEVCEALIGHAGQVELDGDGFAFDQFANSADLVKHPGHHGQQLLGLVRPAPGHRYGGRGRGSRNRPSEWRRFLVRSDSTLRHLHQTLQALFGWSDAHP